MASPAVIDLDSLRSGCAQCSLQQLCLPAGIGLEDLRKLEQIVHRRRRVARGERLYRTGDALSALYVPRQGAFKTTSLSVGGDEQVVGFHLAGELIGLDALGESVHRCESIALTAADVCEVPYEKLSEVALQLPGLHQQLLRVIGQSVGRDQDHASMLGRRHASERIAAFLHGLGERYRHIGQSASRFTLPMSREDIANFLGLAIETVSRGFTRLQEGGVIDVAGRRVSVLSEAELWRLAHGGEAMDRERHRA